MRGNMRKICVNEGDARTVAITTHAGGASHARPLRALFVHISLFLESGSAGSRWPAHHHQSARRARAPPPPACTRRRRPHTKHPVRTPRLPPSLCSGAVLCLLQTHINIWTCGARARPRATRGAAASRGAASSTAASSTHAPTHSQVHRVVLPAATSSRKSGASAQLVLNRHTAICPW